MSTDFYEDDEPVEKIRAAFANGEQGVTAEPVSASSLAGMTEQAAAEARQARIERREQRAAEVLLCGCRPRLGRHGASCPSQPLSPMDAQSAESEMVPVTIPTMGGRAPA